MSAQEQTARKTHDYCLLCGARNPLSLRLVFQPDEDHVVHGVFKGHRGLQGYNGFLHGGVIAALLDASMTHCLFERGIKGFTADLRVRYLHPIPFNAPLALRARLVSSRPPLFRLESRLLHGGTTMARAEARFMPRKDRS